MYHEKLNSIIVSILTNRKRNRVSIRQSKYYLYLLIYVDKRIDEHKIRMLTYNLNGIEEGIL